ncbi:TetR/AcrR family transcriptional regulator [Phenylobacterium sp.]|uniref:TetR/AcrR family transcriptional regulator n=1 Tax=Phenylobacterium sp. TaxID=1871053 RepID=UPI0035AFFEFD
MRPAGRWPRRAAGAGKGAEINSEPRAPTRRYEQRQAAIVAAAVDVLNRKGVRGMTLGEVAAQLDLVPTGVIYYFRNKEELAAACLLRGIETFQGFIAESSGRPTARQRLGAFIYSYFDFQRRAALGEGEPLAVFNDVRGLRRAAVDAAYVDMFRSLRAVLVDPGADEPSRQALNARTHLVLAEILWSRAWLLRREPEDYGRAAGRLFSVLVDGIAAPGAAWPETTLSAAALDIHPTVDDSAEQFLRAATELINEEGYIGASVEKISAKLNVTKGAFYHHNQTKDDLVLACFERTFEVMRRAIRAAEETSSSGLQALVSLCTVLVDYQLSGRAPLLRTSALTSAPEALQPELLSKFDRISERFASLISDGIADGSVRPVDANIAAQAVTAMINAGSELPHWAPDVTRAEAIDLYVRPFFLGLLPPEEG